MDSLAAILGTFILPRVNILRFCSPVRQHGHFVAVFLCIHLMEKFVHLEEAGTILKSVSY